MQRVFIALTLSLLTCGTPTVSSADAGDWPWWRGPNFDGTVEAGELPPLQWSDSQNVVWKTRVPGRGHSSPTVSGDRIYLTTADERTAKQYVLAFDRSSGEQLWQTEVNQGGLPKTHPKNTHATPTVATDGERLFVTFHHHDRVTLYALDSDGEVLWQRVVGRFNPQRYAYGYAASPLLYEDTVIVAADYEQGGYIAAYDRVNGDRKWKADRPRKYSLSSPVVANIGGSDLLLISGCEAVAAYNPKTGKGLWAVPATTMATCGTMVWDDGIVFASGGYPKAETVAIRVGRSPQVLWRNQQKCYEQSMLAHNGYLYAVTDQGIAYCWRAEDGETMWRERLEGPISASPMLVGDRIYASNEAGKTFVFKANPQQFERLATNQLGSEAFATPTFVDGRIYARVADRSGGGRQEFLYCIGDGN